MAWMWWLLAPAISVGLGAVLLSWRDRRAARASTRDPIAAHRALLDALARVEIASSAARPPGTSSSER